MGLFDEQLSRKPNKYIWTQDFIDVMWKGFWTPNEFNFMSDYHQFKTELTPKERGVVTRSLSAIGQIEVAVKTFWGRLGENLPHPAMFDLGYVMANVETYHNMAYEKLLTVLGLEDVFEKNLEEGVVKNRVEYLRKHNKHVYDDKKKQYAYSIILFTLFVENVSLFSQFYTILWLNRYKNILKDTAQQVQYTRNEEVIHAAVGIKLINTMREEYPEIFDAEFEALIYKETKDALKAEAAIIDWMMGDFNEEGLNAPVLKEFITNRMNDSLEAIGYDRVFDVDPEILKETKWFDEELHGNNMVDFFHQRPTDYAKKDKVYSADELF